MNVDWLIRTPHGFIGLALLGILLAATEIGFRLGRRKKREIDEVARSQLNTLQASMLAVLGLLLAFTFGMAGTRYDTGRTEIVLEANAIGTAYLRVDTMPEPLAAAARPLFREYVESRLSFVQSLLQPELTPAARDRVTQIQSKLWKLAVEAAARPQATTGPILLMSFNDMFDAQAARDAAIFGRVPTIILLMLFLSSAAAMAAVGATCSFGRRRNLISTSLFSLLIVLIIVVILDLDRPYRGLIRVKASAMTDLLESMK